MKIKKKRILKLLIAIFVLFLTVGFAGLLSYTYVEGTISFRSDIEDFKIYFSEVSSGGGTVSLSEDKKSFTFNYGPPCVLTSGTGENIGDEITCFTEKFVIYAIEEDTVKVISRYSLDVGGEYNTETQTYKAYSNSFNLQNVASSENNNIRKGVIKYSDTSNVYEGSIVENYVNNYGKKLRSYGVLYDSISILTKEEVDILFASILTSGDLPNTTYQSWLNDTTYWLKTTEGSDNLWVMTNDNKIDNTYKYNGNGEYATASIRPTLTLSKSAIISTEAGAQAIVNYTVANDSKIYDANVQVKCAAETNIVKETGLVQAKTEVSDSVIVPNLATCELVVSAIGRYEEGTGTLPEHPKDEEISEPTTDLYTITTNISEFREVYEWEASNTTRTYYAKLVTVITNNSDTKLETYDGYIYIPESDLFSNYTYTQIDSEGGRYRFNHINRYYGTNPIEPGSTYEITYEIYTDTDLNTVKPYSMLTTNGLIVVDK